MTTFVVGGDGDVDKFSGGVGVAEGDDRDVDVAGFLNGLVVGARIGDDDEAGLLEGAGDVVSEVTRGEAAGNGNGTGVGGELEDSTLAVGTSGNHANVGWVVNGCNDTGSKDDFLPVWRRSMSHLSLSSHSSFFDFFLFSFSLWIQILSYQVLPMLITLIPSGRVFHK